MESKEIEIKRNKFPKEIAISLVVVSLVVSVVPLWGGLSAISLRAVVINLVSIFALMPVVFVVVGLIQKLRDREFNLWNMYYLGMLVGVVLNIQRMAS